MLARGGVNFRRLTGSLGHTGMVHHPCGPCVRTMARVRQVSCGPLSIQGMMDRTALHPWVSFFFSAVLRMEMFRTSQPRNRREEAKRGKTQQPWPRVAGVPRCYPLK